MLPWIYLVAAGVLEIVWAVGLKFTEGFSKPLASFFTIAAIVGSMYLLAKAAQSIPIGTAYGIWVGIGAVGATLLGVYFFNEPLPPLKLVFVILLIVSLVGLKITS